MRFIMWFQVLVNSGVQGVRRGAAAQCRHGRAGKLGKVLHADQATEWVLHGAAWATAHLHAAF